MISVTSVQLTDCIALQSTDSATLGPKQRYLYAKLQVARNLRPVTEAGGANTSSPVFVCTLLLLLAHSSSVCSKGAEGSGHHATGQRHHATMCN